ncbi:branched-chain amino acid ABC transporter permease/ATP-binding protein [Rhodopseudomonas palustris]|uniref:branched-chain amino acid ABC transporter permease/ATP-binding protein n=1 Tax=Rhodopseudomonas palustris TaxID=1076 RepID=UPI002ACE5B05|nr:branched-chain amino acid ABC transporter permease/ATP-binding protein [Rhodopseudomonas palustris]WQG99738.1 branched-chain amino acid ABC transporter permease/ATP-binding protein [Rhodopseudomonas palustris]
MNLVVALFLAQDGIANGVVYALLAVAIVVLFSVTRITFVPQGEFVSYGALTFVTLQDGQRPGTFALLGLLIALHIVIDIAAGWRRQRLATLLVSSLRSVAAALIVLALAYAATSFDLPLLLKAVIAIAVITAAGPLLYRIVYQPLADASVLVLLIVSVALHFVMTGLALYIFGPSGQRSAPLIDFTMPLMGVPIAGQTLLILGVTIVVIAALYFASQHTLYGKAMQAVALNRTGARLMGISTTLAGRTSFLLAAFIGALAGVLISPTTTILYDTGFLLGLKGFVGAILGGLASYPISALGALMIGLLESYSSFFASTYKEVIVFSLIIPILLVQTLRQHRIKEDDDHGGEAIPAQLSLSPEALRRRRQIRTGLGAAFVLAVAAAPLLLSNYEIALLNYVGLAAIVVLGLVLLTGVAGLTSFAQAAYVGIGAYITGYVSSVYGLSPWLTLPMALAVAFVLALFGSLITARLSGHYLPLATLSLAVVAYYLFAALPQTGGQAGMTNIPPLTIFGIAIVSPKAWYVGIWGALLLLQLAMANLLDSRPGRAIRALKSGTIMAESLGVDTWRAKIAAFVIACLLAALAGWFYAHYQRFLNPSPFSFNQGIEYLFMAVIGGAGSIGGALVGSGIVVLANQWLQTNLPLVLGMQGDFQVIIFGVAAMAMLQLLPRGIWPALLDLFRMRLPKSWTFSTDAAPLPARPKPAPGETVLAVRGVCKNFGAIAANRNISLDAKAGEILALIGPNGAGKSTLFDLISGVQRPSSGTVHFLGHESSYFPRTLSRGGMGRTFQHVRILPEMTVVENTALGAHARADISFLSSALRLDRGKEAMLIAEALRQLDRVGLASSATQIAGSLSLGQQRVLEIARALASDPCLLLLDEPAAGLRHLEKQALARLLKQLKAEGMAVIVVEHDMDFVMNLADRIVVMQFGEKLAEGTPCEIQRNPAVIEAYLGGAE